MPAPFDGMEAATNRTVRNFASCGKPMPGYQVEIRDDAAKVLPDRHIGSVIIKCSSLMDGYFRNEEATKACMPGDGWLDTGDMGYLVDGELFITGRKKDMMIVNGRNIWPQDLEWHAENNVGSVTHRDTAAAFAIENADGREVPVILVQCRLPVTERDALRKDVHARRIS